MKYSINTYRLYYNEKNFPSVMRGRVTLKEPVDIDILRRSVNTAIRRYPYYAVHVVADKDGGYVLLPNHKEVVVLPVLKKCPKLGSRRVNGHLLFVECEGKDIYFHMSHSMCGGQGMQPWIMTVIYQYVVDKYHVLPHAPEIRKPGSPLLPDETAECTMETLPDEEPIYHYAGKNPAVMIKDYLTGFYNPFKRDPNYTIFTFDQESLVSFIKENDASVASFFIVAVAKALDRVLPEKIRVIGGETAHNPRKEYGMPNSHCDFLSHAFFDYDRDMLKWDMEKLGTMTRGLMILQTDPSVSAGELRARFKVYDEVDQIKGLKEKRAFMDEHNPNNGKEARHGTFLCNYSGQMDWGEVADYIATYVIIVPGHLVFEVTSVGDKIYLCFMRLFREKKYIGALKEVLDELGIPYKVEGPFPSHISRHVLPD